MATLVSILSFTLRIVPLPSAGSNGRVENSQRNAHRRRRACGIMKPPVIEN
jgi:hypothetical protein